MLLYCLNYLFNHTNFINFLKFIKKVLEIDKWVCYTINTVKEMVNDP